MLVPLAWLFVFPSLAQSQPQPPLDEVVASFTIRAGYEVSLAVDRHEGARFMELDDNGTLYISRTQHGDITAFTDADGDGLYTPKAAFVSGLPNVQGMCFSGGWLWFSTPTSINKARDTNGGGVADERHAVLTNLDGDGTHFWRSLLVTADAIYTSVGDSGNISDQTKTDRQKIWKYALDGTGKELWSYGIRNTEKLRFRPGTDELWGVDHGSDWFGATLGDQPGRQPITDYNPPDELNRYIKGGFYGHPFITGFKIPRYEFQSRPDIIDLADKTIVPEWPFPAHAAANSFTFIDPAINDRTGAFPADHGGDMFIACRGSWNRTHKAGYCIYRVLFDEGKPYGMLKIVSTMSPDGNEVYGRPVDCIQAADGSVLWSDDLSGRVYRLRATAKP